MAIFMLKDFIKNYNFYVEIYVEELQFFMLRDLKNYIFKSNLSKKKSSNLSKQKIVTLNQIFQHKNCNSSNLS